MTSGKPLGLSSLYPVVPALSVLSVILTLLVLPGFVKTRVLAIISFAVWLIVGNLLILVNMSLWRGNTRRPGIYGDITSKFWSIFSVGLYLNSFCFHKFIWNLTRSSYRVKVYKERRRTNIIDGLICILLPLMWVPLYYLKAIFTSSSRYIIVEDAGPFPLCNLDLTGILVYGLPLFLLTMASASMDVLASMNLWRARRPSANQLHRPISPRRMYKYLLLFFTSFCCMTFGATWSVLAWVQHAKVSAQRTWLYFTPVSESLFNMRLVFSADRLLLDTEGANLTLSITGFLISVPCCGIYLFAFFGLEKEVREGYITGLKEAAHLLSKGLHYVHLHKWASVISRLVGPAESSSPAQTGSGGADAPAPAAPEERPPRDPEEIPMPALDIGPGQRPTLRIHTNFAMSPTREFLPPPPNINPPRVPLPIHPHSFNEDDVV